MIGKTVLAFGIFTSTLATITQLPLAALTQLEEPSYAQWGKLAIKETKAKYPHANIIDYSHEGNEIKGHLSIEKFKLWLKEDGHEFGVHIRIEYVTETKKLTSITFQETTTN